MGTTTALVGEAFDRLGDAVGRKAQDAIIGKAPTTLPAVPNVPQATFSTALHSADGRGLRACCTWCRHCARIGDNPVRCTGKWDIPIIATTRNLASRRPLSSRPRRARERWQSIGRSGGRDPVSLTGTKTCCPGTQALRTCGAVTTGRKSATSTGQGGT